MFSAWGSGSRRYLARLRGYDAGSKGHGMRLADFILANTEPILAEWEVFARTIWPGAKADALALRDHAHDILQATALDMKSFQNATQQADKSKGEGEPGKTSGRVDGASDVHAVARALSGFNLLALVAEYRALRASVIRLWRESAPDSNARDLDDLTRFNESIDQSLTEAVRSYTQRVDRSRQMFLAILGHDLRNPLNSISLSAQVLSLTGGLDDECTQTASQISSSAAAMARMIGDLLDFTSTGLGVRIPLSPAPMNLKGLCQEVVAEICAAHPECAVRYEPHGDFTGDWDSSRLRQVVSNLLGNAVQHGAASGCVDLSLTGEGSDVLLAVSNGGPPIPREALPTIFDPLVRGSTADSQKQRRPGSIGLGLYIAREIVTAHGGTIDVKSSDAAGTVFTVRLPRHPGRPVR